jgi:L-asparaginase
MKNKVLIIYTGGTIGMKPSDKGLIPEEGFLREKIHEILEYELSTHAMPEVDIIEFHPLIDSSDIDLGAINKIAQTINQNMDKYLGFVVLHGTDTMAYTSSALSFLLHDLKKPVIVTGSQIPFSQFRSDGRNNLVNSIYIASSVPVQEVRMYFNDQLLRGSRVTKFITDDFDAFTSLNESPIAEIGVQIKLDKDYRNPISENELQITALKESNVEFLHLYPGYHYENLNFYLNMQLNALVIVGFGVGNVPTHDKFQTFVNALLEQDTKVFLKSQCPVGDMAMETYNGGFILHEKGVLPCFDMSTEAIIMKIMYLMSTETSPKEFKRLWHLSLVGEFDY